MKTVTFSVRYEHRLSDFQVAVYQPGRPYRVPDAVAEAAQAAGALATGRTRRRRSGAG